MKMHLKMLVSAGALPSAKHSINPFTPHYPQEVCAKWPSAVTPFVESQTGKVADLNFILPVYCKVRVIELDNVDRPKPGKTIIISDGAGSGLVAQSQATIDLPVRRKHCAEICCKLLYYTCAVIALFLIWYYGYYDTCDVN